MITNPEDTGIYNPQIDKYVEVLHDAGALAFTDQANANGILGFARARDAGFDACHFNLHKTFSSPHGCEGPATGAYMCTDELAQYLPVPVVTKAGDRYHLDYDRPESIGRVRGFLGNWMGVIRAYAWIRNMGPRGLKEVAEISVLNNNYLDNLLMAVKGVSRPYAEGHRRLDQVRYSLEQLKEDTGVGTEALRDRMVDFGIQSFWMSHHPVGRARALHARALRDLQQGRPRRVGRGHQEGHRRGLRGRAVRARLAARPAHRSDAAHRGHGGARPVGLHVARLQETRPGAQAERRSPTDTRLRGGRRRGRAAARPRCIITPRSRPRPCADERTSWRRSSLPADVSGNRSGSPSSLCTALVLLALVITRLTDPIDVRGAALVLSTLAATVACLAMLADAFDLWMLGRRDDPVQRAHDPLAGLRQRAGRVPPEHRRQELAAAS